mmetsp:Transcript_37888/g.108950  ORF Transcript_37888/g.108950 Transcript_37888/m.108950 type:complete len:225 (-) Transcript_37888:365-1039(-)
MRRASECRPRKAWGHSPEPMSSTRASPGVRTTKRFPCGCMAIARTSSLKFRCHRSLPLRASHMQSESWLAAMISAAPAVTMMRDAQPTASCNRRSRRPSASQMKRPVKPAVASFVLSGGTSMNMTASPWCSSKCATRPSATLHTITGSLSTYVTPPATISRKATLTSPGWDDKPSNHSRCNSAPVLTHQTIAHASPKATTRSPSGKTSREKTFRSDPRTMCLST